MDKMDRKLDMEMAKKADTRTGKTVMWTVWMDAK
jgi:hypothetical protein